MTTQTFLPYAKQSISAEDVEEIARALQADLITRGPQVDAFESEAAAYCGARYAVAFSSGSAALAAAFYAANVSPNDLILSTPNTFVSSIGTALPFGGTPVFVDIDLETGAADVEHLAHNANRPLSRGKPIIVPVHFAGIPFDTEYLDSLLTNPDAIIIEDAAHAIGTNYPRGGPKVGSCAWSRITTFSFHPAKTITTGEGGMATTNSEELYHRLKSFRNNGIERDPKYLHNPPTPWYYEVHVASNNFNFTDFQAALGRSQLKRLDRFVEKRRSLMQDYRNKLAGCRSIKLLTPEYDSHTAFHLCVAQIDFAAYGKQRAQVMEKLKLNGIGTQVHYIPVYRHPIFQTICGDIADYFPAAETYYAQALTLPLYYEMTHDDVSRVVDTLKHCLQK